MPEQSSENIEVLQQIDGHVSICNGEQNIGYILGDTLGYFPSVTEPVMEKISQLPKDNFSGEFPKGSVTYMDKVFEWEIGRDGIMEVFIDIDFDKFVDHFYYIDKSRILHAIETPKYTD